MRTIQEQMILLSRDLQVNYGEHPEAFLLGPRDFLELCQELSVYRKYIKSNIDISSPLDLKEYSGIPIIIKQQDGVDIAINKNITIQKLTYGKTSK